MTQRRRVRRWAWAAKGVFSQPRRSFDPAGSPSVLAQVKWFHIRANASSRTDDSDQTTYGEFLRSLDHFSDVFVRALRGAAGVVRVVGWARRPHWTTPPAISSAFSTTTACFKAVRLTAVAHRGRRVADVRLAAIGERLPHVRGAGAAQCLMVLRLNA